jgi:hypothetical protein
MRGAKLAMKDPGGPPPGLPGRVEPGFRAFSPIQNNSPAGRDLRTSRTKKTTRSDSCPSHGSLTFFRSGAPAPITRRSLEGHLDSCP